ARERAPAHTAPGLPPDQIGAYRIADNQTTRLSEWDTDRLVAELVELQSVKFDLDVLGFPADELAALINPNGTEGLTDPDAVPEPPHEPITRPGDLRLLGNHRPL